MSDVTPRRILIAGGGTAGWMTALLVERAWGQHGFEVTLVESPDIGIIGVGEGSTPQLKNFMDQVGIAEADWMPRANATWKLGIGFYGWSEKPGFDHYFHPFPAQTDDWSVPTFFYNSFVRRKGIEVEGHPDPYFLNTRLAAEKRGPIAAETFPFTVQYGYHFDSGLLGQYLAEVAVARGVRHLQARIQDAQVDAHGKVLALRTDGDRVLEADLFFDCTGFRSLLSQQLLKVPFVSFADNLFNDAAVVFPSERQAEIAPQTRSTALSHGWAWTIPLTSRVGNGYVYSSRYTDAEAAERELRAFTGVAEEVEARHLKMKVGRVARHWESNCVAVGLSQGFIEPLEATALHLVQETVQGFIAAWEEGGFTEEKRDLFNQRTNQRFEAVRDYIVCHYKVNSRTDTDYWRDNAGNDRLSRSLYDVLSTWMAGKNLSDELARQKIDDYYPSISWHCLLGGYGLYPDRGQLREVEPEVHRRKLAEVRDFVRRCSLNYTPHEDMLATLQASPG